MSRQLESGEGTEALPIEDCWVRLGRSGIGILAMAGVAAPVLRPVNYVVHEGSIVIRTGPGQIAAAARSVEPASFVVSAVDRFEHTGWSVVVEGKLVARSGVGDIEDLPLRPWARAEKNEFVSLSVERISGRRLAEETPP